VTARDRSAAHKLLRDLTREAIDAGTYGEPAPEHAHSGSEQANDHALRDRIADVLKPYTDPDDDTVPVWYDGVPIPMWRPVSVLLDELVAEVQAELDQQAAEIARLTGQLVEARAYARYLDEDVIQPERHLHEETIARAEAAERQLAQLRGLHQQIGDL